MPWFDHPDNPSDPRAAVLLTFLAGIILLGMAVFKLGFLERVETTIIYLLNSHAVAMDRCGTLPLYDFF